QDTVPVESFPRVAVGGAEEGWVVKPGTAAAHTLAAIACCSRAAVDGGAAVGAILRPFPHVAVDIVEAPWVGVEAVDGHRALPILTLRAASLVAVSTAIIVGLLRRDPRTPPERRRRFRARDILSLGPREQPIGFTGLA